MTPEREESPSVLDTFEETLAAKPPMFASIQEKTTWEATLPVTPPMLDPLVNTVLQKTPVGASPILSQHAGTLTSPIFNPQPSTSWAITPKDVFPIPKALPKTKKIIRKRGRTAILTSSPYKNELGEEKLKLKQKKAPKSSAKDNKTGKTTKKVFSMLMMMIWMMTMNAFTVVNFGLSQDTKMLGCSALFVKDGLIKHTRDVMTKTRFFFANFVHKTCDFLINN